MKFNKKYMLLFLIVILSLAIISSSEAYTGTGFSHDIPFSKYSSISINDILNKYNDTECHSEVSGKCTYVVDGDTIDVEGVGRVRFVGVNTPERGVEGYICSKRFVQKLCLDREVSLDIDDKKQNDKYGRTLAVVIVDGKNLNEMLLKEGLAEVMYIPPSEFYPYNWADNATSSSYSSSSSSGSGSSYSSYSSSSSSSSLSSSSSSGSSSSNYVASVNANKFHYSSCRWASKISDSNKITFSSRSDAISQGYKPCNVCQP